LQSIIDQLRGVDEKAQLTPRETKKTELETRLDEFTVVNNKLLDIKSAALSLSLNSTYIDRTVDSSDIGVLSASALSSTPIGSTSVTVDRLAENSSWLSAGMSAADSKVNIPVSQETTSGVADPAVGAVMLEGETMTITFAGSHAISLTAPAGGWTMNDLVGQINNHADNQGGPGDNGRYVTAETYTSGTDTYLRIKSDSAGGTGETNRVAVTEDLSTLDFAAPAEQFDYKVGGNTVSVSVAADTTITSLAGLINDDVDNPGITASVVDDGSGTSSYKLLLQADSTGEDNRISITSQLDDLTLTEQEGASGASLNSQLTVGGISYQRQTNTVNDVVSGVTMTIAATGSATVTVNGNDEDIKTLVTDMVTAYNDAVSEIKAKTAYDKSTGKFGLLADTSLRDLAFDLQSLMTSTVRADATGTITTLFDLGLEFDRDGNISIDSSALDAAISSHPDAFQSFFLGDDSRDITGMADLVNDRLRSITSIGGQIEGEKTATKQLIADLEDQITLTTSRLDRKYDNLSKQFVELDRYMSQMTALSDYLTSQFDSLTKSSGGSSGSK